MKSRRKTILLSALLLVGGIAHAQVLIEGNVYGGGNKGVILNDTVHQGGAVVVSRIDSTTVIINGGRIKGSVYGGGLGDTLSEKAGLVEGNTRVEMRNGTVVRSIYGGGQLGSVGTFNYSTVTYPTNDPNGNEGKTVEVPASLKVEGTGRTRVLVSGGRVGVINQNLMPTTNNPGDDELGWVFCGSQGLADSIHYPKAIGHGFSNDSYLHISGGLITASAYGGSENGMLLDSTYVLVSGGQIGVGHYIDDEDQHRWDSVYSTEKWNAAISAVSGGNPATINSIASQFHECDAWPYGKMENGVKKYYVYDIFADEYDSQGGALEGSNGHSFFGNVFGGGSGYYPIAPGVWRRTAGRVNGNTRVEITGGHILTSIYGGNEVTDVVGKATVKMTGGTLGVPRTLEQIAAHPVTCYLFGAGMGDPRILFNTWTNVENVDVEIGGDAFFFGSVFGGGEEGHVLEDVNMTIKGNAWIGTWGRSYVDGNVFGGGRGFSGEALTAGVVGGNIEINIKKGTILGSIYGGGRLASVGTNFTAPDDINYGQMQNGDEHGIVTINITGGTIGNDYEAKYHTRLDTIPTGGNVFAGAMGRLTKLDGTFNPLWPNLGKVKKTILTINENDGTTIIKGNVYGGGQFGMVTDSTSVNITGGTIWRDVYGGGYGSHEASANSIGVLKRTEGTNVNEYRVSPMQYAGRVEGNTHITVNGGWIKKCIYGGGELASVGYIADSTRHIQSGEPSSGVVVHPLYLSWPYEFGYANNTGRATVKVKGGRIGITGKDYMGPWNVVGSGTELVPVSYDNNGVAQALSSSDIKNACVDNGDIYGGCKGETGSTYIAAHMANVNQSVVTIKYPDDNSATPANYKPVATDNPSLSSKYMTGFYEKWSDWQNWITSQSEVGAEYCVTGAVYGGAEDGHVNDSTSITLHKGLVGHAMYGGGKGKGEYNGHNVLTAGKVYGNTHITVNGGYVVRSIFGGGNLASVGKGNYIGLEGGETTNDASIIALANGCGHTYVNIHGGEIGMLPIDTDHPDDVIKDSIPYGSVFGGARGRVVNTSADNGDFFGYANFTHVTIGKTVNSSTAPRLYGSVYGGAQDGHVRRKTNVTVNAGEIGVEFVSPTAAAASVGNNNPKSRYWTTRGNVFGGGSGVGPYDETNPNSYSPIAGSVLGGTNVTINGGLIHRIVFGGGNLAKVNGKANVTVNSTIGVNDPDHDNIFNDFKNYDYGGYVFGGGRGILKSDMLETYAFTDSTEVTFTAGIVPGDIYGGGAMGQVATDTKVNMTGGQVGLVRYTKSNPSGDFDGIEHVGLEGCGNGSVYGGGMGVATMRDAAHVKGNTDVTIGGGHVYFNVYGGGKVASVGLREPIKDANDVIIDYKPKKNDNDEMTGVTHVIIKGGQIGPEPKTGEGYNIPVGINGTDGYVFGGGKGISNDYITNPTHPYSGSYYEVADVNYSYVTVNMPMPTNANDITNRIWASTYGGAEDGHVLGDAHTKYISGLMGPDGTANYGGNIFGSGRNMSKANYNAGRVRGNTYVHMCGGQIYGSIFGGGRYALTGVDLYGNIISDESGTNGAKYGKTNIRVNGGTVGNDTDFDDPTYGTIPYIMTQINRSVGDVYGGGKGDMEGIFGHPEASALLVSLVKNTEVLVTDSIKEGSIFSTPKILGSVFGGGEVANVGQYTWTMFEDNPGHMTIGDIALVEGTGKAKVTISGGQIGLDKMQMLYEVNDDYTLKYNCDLGHVFGGGEGRADNPGNVTVNPPSSGSGDIHSNKPLLDLMATVGETQVTISNTTNGETEIGSAWVKGSVYGGAMSGHVLGNTEVTVSGGQIGAGYNPQTGVQQQTKYAEGKFINPVTYFGTTHPDYADVAADDALLGCYQWEYDSIVQRPFDLIKFKTDSTYKPTNGETWFGSVYGGGSGYYPYIVPVEGASPARDTAIWNPETGRVYGNATVEITGGHILSNVYGGSQISDVGAYAIADAAYHATHQAVPVGELYCISGGKATVTISGGTVGVPRTIDSIAQNPILGDVYGGCQGDFREQLALLSNVDSTKVTISETAIVYGSVFGGAENGHVVDSTKVIVSGGIIGTTGLSGEDGNVFGGGQGSAYYESLDPDTTGLTLYEQPGRVGGNTHVKMSSGKVLGCLYGGGSMALTGVGKSGKYSSYVDNTSVYDSTYHGRTMVELSGGTIGNNLIRGGYDLLMSENEIGNVYGGGRGHVEAFIEDDFGRAANALVKITGSPVIYGSVYGGGQMANVGHWNTYETWYTKKTGTTSVSIEGTPTIGSALEFDYDYSQGTIDLGGGLHSELPLWTYYDTINGMRMIERTCTGNVHGSGQGDVTLEEGGIVTGLEHGHCRTTLVNIDMDNPTNGVGGGHIRGSVYGGAEQGAVWGETKVTIAGGTIGTMGIRYDTLKFDEDDGWISVYHYKEIDSTYSYGSVYGGSYGRDIWKHFKGDPYFDPDNPKQIDSVNRLSGCVYGNTEVNITGGIIRGNVYGGGDMASVGIWDSITDSNNHLIDIQPMADSVRTQFKGNATVNVSGGEIGPLDGTGLNAYVFGGGKGFYYDPDTLRRNFTNVDSTFVTISGGKIWGSVFGGANDGHVLGSASVIVHADADIGDDGLSTWDGNIFGGGRNFVNSNHCNGRVAGNIDITMDGGTIQGSIFGGGRLALTGVDLKGKPYLTSAGAYDAEDHGLVTITVSGTEPDTTYKPEIEPPVIDTIIYHTSIGNPDGDELLNGSDESVGDIFGSGKGDTKRYADILAGRVANTKITISGYPRIYGSVFGGGEMASIGYWHKVGNKQVFYGDSGESEVTIGLTSADNPIIGTDYEYTVDYSNSTPPPDWTVYDTIGTLPNNALLLKLIHTCTGNVFGGSQGDVNPARPHWVSMGRSRKTKVVVNGGTIKSCVYGGAEQGSVATDTYVEINGGSIGSEVTAADNSTYLFGGVFGGGYGSHRQDYNGTTYHGAAITNDSTDYLSNGLWTANHLAGRVYGNTLVNIMGGEMVDIYGGADYAYVGAYGTNPKGNVRVNIGRLKHVETPTPEPFRDSIPEGDATIKGMVFGANNHAGTPFGSASVHVYKTHHTEQDEYPDGDPCVEPTTPEGVAALPSAPENFAIRAVYGGSNRADYTPVDGKNDTVHVYFCRENTIYEVYGGSNAADIGPSTTNTSVNSYVIIDGGRVYSVFGGGNGTAAETSADIHGSANTTINGGLINELYGGSNANGNIDEINLVVNEDTGCPVIVSDGFGGGSASDLIGNLEVTLRCGDNPQYGNFYGGSRLGTIYGNLTVNVYGGRVTNLFAGSKGQADPAIAADIKKFPSDWNDPGSGYSQAVIDYMTAHSELAGTGGNVTLNLYGGTIDNAFGGSNVNGNIEGLITVNVLDDEGECPLDVSNIYGGSNDTEYNPDDIIVNGESVKPVSPVVNVMHIAQEKGVRQNVFGGGKGSGATVIANPQVNIGYDATTMSSLIPVGYPATSSLTSWPRAYVEGSVYGGGENASVTGTTNVRVQHDNAFVGMNVYGGGMGDNSHSDYAFVSDNTNVEITCGSVMGEVYGGGDMGSVGKDASVTISGGIIGRKLDYSERHLVEGSNPPAVYNGNVYGGGRGVISPSQAANPNYNSAVLGRVYGNTEVTISGNTVVRHNVYGGGSMASVGTFTMNDAGNITSWTSGGTATVNIGGSALIGPKKADLVDATQATQDANFKCLGENEGYVYGSSRGNADYRCNKLAYVKETFVNIGGTAQVVGTVMGGGENGRVYTDTEVTIGDPLTTDAPVIGGMQLHGTSYTETDANSEYNGVTVNLSADDSEILENSLGVGRKILRGNVFGGGRGADTYVHNEVTQYNPISGQVFGNTKVTIHRGTIYNRVYGGGSLGSVGTFTYDDHNTDSIISFASGTGKAEVIVNGGQIGTNGRNNGDVFGGGKGIAGRTKQSTYYPNTDQVVHLAYVGETDVKINSGVVIKSNVYGGAANGHVQGDTYVTVDGATVGLSGDTGWHGNVYGGGGGTETAYTHTVTPPGGGTPTTEDHLSISAGRVFGGTNVTIKQSDDTKPTRIYNSVYGGGAVASVGGYKLGQGLVGSASVVEGSGITHVDITGGTIGVDGNNNGMVYGSSRGFTQAPGNFADSLSYAVTTTVNIGAVTTSGNPPVPVYSGNALIKGNVYGSGENGHVVTDATVNVYGGTIDGDVFGGGSGDEKYDGTHYNNYAGVVSGNTYVNICDGQVKGNVYGGGELGSLLNPYTNPVSYGKATIRISGGKVGFEQIGVNQASITNGYVYGGCLGLAGNDYADFANVGNTEIYISGGYIYGTVFGGADNGHVQGDTKIEMTDGIVGQRNTLAELLTLQNEQPVNGHIYTGNVLGGGRGTTEASPGVYHHTTGIVRGNTEVTISGGTVRHGVYGGGGLSSVGTFTTNGSDEITGFTENTGTCTVTVNGTAVIGPKKEDIVGITDPDELAAAATALGMSEITSAQYADTIFKHLGGNAGWVYGAGCGLASQSKLTFNYDTDVTIGGTAQVVGSVFGGGENGHVFNNTEVALGGNAIIGGFPLHGGDDPDYPGTYKIGEGVYKDVTVHLDDAEDELEEDNYGAGIRRVFRGNVYGGGKGTDFVSSTPTAPYSPTAGRVYGTTKVTIGDNAKIYNRVFGGGSIASVGKLTYDLVHTDSVVGIASGTGTTTVILNGGVIGTNGKNNGDVFGGGHGKAGRGWEKVNGVVIYPTTDQVVNLAFTGNTNVTVNSGAVVKSNVYGGPANGHVKGNTHVIVDGGTVGYTYEDNGVTKVHGGWHSNVYGGGGGLHRYQKNSTTKHHSITSGRVYGNTKIEIKSGNVWHNVYGGGAIASVGTYNIYDPAHYIVGTTGEAEVYITGGTIGYNGDENGMVFGSGRGEIDAPDAFMDSLSFVFKSLVSIGKEGETPGQYEGNAKVNGSVYGSGENGHVFEKATVKVYSGTIGCTAAEFAAMSDDEKEKKFPYRGNVYGAGCGTDKYKDVTDNKWKYNPKSGIVYGDTKVEIYGGYISHNVYGGGAMASVGLITSKVKHETDYHLSWPYELAFLNAGFASATGGKAEVEIKGGHIGTAALSNVPLASGNVFGSSRGDVGDRYTMALFANVKEAHVKVNFTPAGTSFDDDTEDVIIGSVFGSGESGHVYDDTHVTITNGLIVGSLFGGGDGTDTYKDLLMDPDNPGHPLSDSTLVHSITAGKVYGNTNVTVHNGYILHSVYGGGNMASVGKGNYIGYGETGDQSVAEACGKTFVNIYGGTIGTEAWNTKGHVFGSSKGTAFRTINETPRYDYSRDFFIGYANKSFVTIGEATPSGADPRIYGSVFGGGENGHIRFDTEVTVNANSVIGVPYTAGATITDDEWKYRGNVYGAGQGIDMYDSNGDGTPDSYCPSAGSVTENTHVTVNGGIIYRDVYGGGSLANVGPPPTYTGPSLTTVDIKGGTIGTTDGVANKYGGNVFGSSRGEIAAPSHPTLNIMATVLEAHVNIGNSNGTGNPRVYGSVYGSGDNGHVSANTLVNVYSGNIGIDGQKVDIAYQGNVFGGGSGMDTYLVGTTPTHNPNAGKVTGHAHVFINGGTTHGSVYGGGNTSNVLEERVVTINDGTVKGHAFGGCNSGIADDVPFTSLKTVNVRGGHIEGSVFGCSYDAMEGDAPANYNNWEDGNKYWTSFVNITGGTIGWDGPDADTTGNVYAAGYGGTVRGSVCVNVGYYPIDNAPNSDRNRYASITADPSVTIDPLEENIKDMVVKGSVYGGSYHVGNGQLDDLWNTYDVTGYSVAYIDGTGYDTQNAVPTSGQPKFMNIEGGLYGCGTHCESGQLGRDIILRNYGQRNAGDEVTSVTREIKTAQRCNNFVLDHANVHFKGLDDISGKSDSLYAVVKINRNLYVADSSSMILGLIGKPAYMDSIVAVHSAYLTSGNVYANDNVTSLPWGWIGLQEQSSGYGDELVFMNGTTLVSTLKKTQENVILFNGMSRMWVRYHTKVSGDDTQLYGELQGFFRMRSNHYQPYGNASFAYARPKLTALNGYIPSGGQPDPPVNASDGGFLSYNTDYNFHTRPFDNYSVDGNDGGSDYTKTKQYPYSNLMEASSKDGDIMDMVEFRLWAIPRITGRPWYVDGRDEILGGIGKNDMGEGRGLYPDLPKLTVSAKEGENKEGIYAGGVDFGDPDVIPFKQEDDVIYVVGAVNSAKELAVDASGILNQDQSHPLRLYRYPGGHALSASTATDPGPNYKALVEVCNEGNSLTLNNVLIDGLFGYEGFDGFNYAIPSTFDEKGAYMPMVVTYPNVVLTLEKGTNLMNGYNTIDVDTISKSQSGLSETIDNFYHNPDFTNSGIPKSIYNGAALFVDEKATVNVSGSITIIGNKQRRMVGALDHSVDCNVYLPTFEKSLTIKDALDPDTKIGVTSPVRNNDVRGYKYNTLSPVAVGSKADAVSAWTNDNFLDDQKWFFGNSNHSTYHSNEASASYMNPESVYFGWTWANVVRKEPTGFAVNDINSAEDLAWLITRNTGMNGNSLVEAPTTFSGTKLVQTADLDMEMYVWVPIGEHGNHYHTFAGEYDGKGHLIANMNIDFIGNGDTRYHRKNYGLFGYVTGDVDRTFVVSGKVIPEISVAITDRDELNVGGLAGCLAGGSITNSEAAVVIDSPDKSDSESGLPVADNMSAGGLVGMMVSGTVHSSMAMPQITIQVKEDEHPFVPFGGLVGSAAGGTIYNSFVNGKFTFAGDPELEVAGGLLGYNNGATMMNCYVNWDEGFTAENFKSIVGKVDGHSAGSIDYCYFKEDGQVSFDHHSVGLCGEHCKAFTPTVSADRLGYMYLDNKVEVQAAVGETPAKYQPLFQLLDKWAKDNSTSSNTYARWARPGLTEINGDYPVLLLYDGSAADIDDDNEFRSLSTYNKDMVLQYGGTVRDGKQLSTMLGREEYVFVYGDVNETVSGSLDVKASKVSIYEHASILHSALLTKKKKSSKDDTYVDYENTYVGVTFDNSFGGASSTPGINYGLVGMGGFLLPRDWHMFSTPLSNAPLGFNYMVEEVVEEAVVEVNTNEKPYISGDAGAYYNNPWVSTANEFSWLNGGNAGNNRYWMKDYDVADGYFPTGLDASVTLQNDDLFIVNGPLTPSDECPASGVYRYPYGMDFYTWNEPQYHWINFKRNGPNHWHSDVPHVHLDYVPVVGADSNKNEDELIVGRGYMAAITKETFMQSHGKLNDGAKTIMLTNKGYMFKGWNLVGNPYHGYIDFDAMVSVDSCLSNYNILAKKNGNPYYVVYNADAYRQNGGSKDDKAGTAFRYYTPSCSRGGEYAQRYLHPHQGFYVKAEDTDNLTFKEGYLVDRATAGNSGGFRDDRPAYPLVNLYLSSDQGCADVTVIEFERPEWGGAQKLKELRVGDGLFYGHHDGTYYAALFAQEGVDRVPLWFEAKEDDIFTMKWNMANADFHSMYLIDNINGIHYDMLMNDTYTFEGHKGDYPSRFLIVFNLTDVEEHGDEPTVFAFHNGNEWIVTGEGMLQFIDVNGRVLWQDRLNGGQSKVNLPWVAEGPYLFRLTNSQETKVQKVIVRH